MNVPQALRFDPSLKSFPTLRGLCNALLAVVTLGRSGLLDRVQGVIVQADLPAPLADIVLRTTRATRLWPSEQHDVARELASHFREGLDSGVPADTLAADFGDARVSAGLIRRAARRKRPVAWKAWTIAWKGVASLLLTLLVLYALFTLRYYTGSPSIKRNFYNELNAKTLATPADQRAWPEYRRALMAMPDMPGDEIMNEWPAISVDDPQYVIAAAYIKAAAPQLDVIRAASKRSIFGAELLRTIDVEFEVRMAERRRASPESIRAVRDTAVNEQLPENPDAIGLLLPALGRIRGIARDLKFDNVVARQEGDGGRVAANIHACLGIADQMGREDTVIGQLVGYAILHLGVEEVKTTLSEEPGLLTDADLSSIAHAMAMCIEPGELTIDFSGERFFMEDLLQRVYTDDGHGDGRLTDEGMDYLMKIASMNGESPLPSRRDAVTGHAVGPVFAQVLAGRKDMLREYNRVLDLTIADASRPMHVRMADPARDEIERLVHDNVWSARYLPLKVLLPAINHVQWSGQRVSLERDAAATAVACELFRRRTGAWPRSLSEVPRNLLPRVPIDPFTGKEVLYRLVNGAPVLYSAGNDQDDDGGTQVVSGDPGRVQSISVIVDGDWLLWPLPRKE